MPIRGGSYGLRVGAPGGISRPVATQPSRTGMARSLRVEIPLSTFSPGLRARTKAAISCWWLLTGKPRRRRNTRVAHPSDPVTASGGIENWLNGVAVAYTSAPWTGPPPLAVTWKRTSSADVPRVTTRGSDWSLSTRSRAGGTILDTWSGLPPGGQPGPRDGGGAGARWITAVGTEVEELLPSELAAVTRRRSVAPTSAEVSR